MSAMNVILKTMTFFFTDEGHVSRQVVTDISEKDVMRSYFTDHPSRKNSPKLKIFSGALDDNGMSIPTRDFPQG